MAKRLKVGIFFGGKSPEHDISVMSGREVLKNINKEKYVAIPIFISKDGASWKIGENEKRLDSPAALKKLIDIAFIVMHGPFGEDGTIQRLLEKYNIPYTGSGVLASVIGMDKVKSQMAFKNAGLTVPNGIVFKKGQRQSIIWQKLKPPIFVKPNNQGSSVGTSKVNSKKELPKALKTAFLYSDEVLIDEYIDGTEITGAVLGNENSRALPIVEIVPKREFFDLEAKYDANLTDEIVPARISKALTKKAQEAAICAYEAVGCQAFGRVDMILKGDKVYVLEVNTIPGLTPVSLFPKAAKAAGISYTRLLDKIISFSLGK